MSDIAKLKLIRLDKRMTHYLMSFSQRDPKIVCTLYIRQKLSIHFYQNKVFVTRVLPKYRVSYCSTSFLFVQ